MDIKEVSLKEYFNDKVSALEKKVDSAYQEQKEAVAVALLAQEKAVQAAFAASDKAIIKAEDAQKDYNERSNEFRGQLDDQAKMLMPRIEITGLLKADAEKVEVMKKDIDGKFEGFRTANEKMQDGIAKEIQRLREYRAGDEGRYSQSSVDNLASKANWGLIFSAVSSIVSVISVIIVLSRFIK